MYGPSTLSAVARTVVECRDHVDMPQWLAISVLGQQRRKFYELAADSGGLPAHHPSESEEVMKATTGSDLVGAELTQAAGTCRRLGPM